MPPVASISWPTGLPQRHLVDGYTMTPQPSFMKSDFDQNPSNYRYYNSRLSKQVTLGYAMSLAQLATFKDFVTDDLHNGIRWFRCEVSKFSGWVDASVRIINDGQLYRVTQLVPTHVLVSFTAEAILDEETIIVDNEGFAILASDGSILSGNFTLPPDVEAPQAWPFSLPQSEGWEQTTQSQGRVTEMDDGDDLVRGVNTATRRFASYQFCLQGGEAAEFIHFADYTLSRSSKPFTLDGDLVRFSDPDTPWQLTPLGIDNAVLSTTLEYL